MTQSEFDRQAEITRLLLEGVSSTHVCILACLHTTMSSPSQSRSTFENYNKKKKCKHVIAKWVPHKRKPFWNEGILVKYKMHF